jgi:cytochrome c-type biogenesis protein CcmH/NrfG
LDDTNVDAYLCLGGAYESLSFAEKAYNAYQYALRVDPESSKAQEALARLKHE